MNTTVTFFKNAFDNAVTDDCAISYTWSELVDELRAGLVISDDKNSLGFVWAKYNTADPAELAPTSATDPTPKRNRSGQPMARRVAANVIEYYGLCLDYDGDAGLAETRAAMEGLKHLGYTSFNHVIKGKDKFRVLIPFSTPCPHGEYRVRVDAFKAMFHGTDRQTFDSSRIFYAPNVSAANRQHYQFWAADGDALDWAIFDPTPEFIPDARPALVNQLRELGGKFSARGTGLPDFKTFDIVQFASELGMNPRPTGNGKWNVICPRVHEHTHSDPSGSVIYDRGNNDPHFYCSHSHGSSWFFDHFTDYFGEKRSIWMKPWCEKLELQETSR